MQLPALLIVDDDPATLTLLKFTMRKLTPSYDILAADTGHSALRRLAERPIALLLSELSATRHGRLAAYCCREGHFAPSLYGRHLSG